MSLKVVAGKKRTEVFLYDMIGPDGSGISHAAVVNALANVRGPVLVRINSPGGEVSQGVGIYNAFAEYSRTKGSVDVQIDAEASSIAAMIATVGGSVTMADNAVWMMHRAWTFAGGNANDMAHVADYLNKVDATQQVPAFARKSGRPHSDIIPLLDKETWYTPEEALAARFIDRIAPAGDAAPTALSPNASKFRLAAQRGEAGRPFSAQGHGDYLTRALGARARSAR